jgi:glycerophosphoryl diester phosphodiesterase
MDQNLKLLKEIPIAHRGYHGDFDNEIIPENTIRAAEEACQRGYAIEGDVRITKDGRLLWFHDSNLKRMTNNKVNIPIDELSERDRLKTKLLGTEYIIPTLEEVLRAVDGRVPLLIELKKMHFKSRSEQKEYFGIVRQALKNYKDKGSYFIQGFGPNTIMYKHYGEQDVPVGLLVLPVSKILYTYYLKLIEQYSYDFLAIGKQGVSQRLITKFKNESNGEGPVLIWTVKNENQLNKALQKGDNIIFENFEPVKIKILGNK